MTETMPVAEYLRMSSEHQQYSLANQHAKIAAYADKNRFHIVKTYSDGARTGVVLKRRNGLRQLLQDVMAGNHAYKAILVYDVSRWGRFQDTDESAHYEFLCKSAGVPVHYCAETFANDGSLPSLIMKALKRTMAGEYSRELGVKVLDGQRRLAQLGFKQGGLPGYGFRRMLVSADGSRKQLLKTGERKSIASDRVILVPGIAGEVQIVKEIYRMLITDGISVYAIAEELNRRGVTYTKTSGWDYQAVYGILSHPKYAGSLVFGRTTSKLYTPTIKLPKTEWIFKPEAFEPLVGPAVFNEAQGILEGRTVRKSNDEILADLRKLLAREGRLSLNLIKNTSGVASPSTYRQRFGSLRQAYEMIGYGRPEHFSPIDLRRRTQAMREELMARIAAMFPQDVAVVCRGGRWRSRLKFRNRRIVSVLVARSVRTWKSSVRWRIDPVGHERGFVTVLARLSEGNDGVLDLHIFGNMDHRRRFHIARNDSWLNRGLLLKNLTEFRDAVLSIR